MIRKMLKMFTKKIPLVSIRKAREENVVRVTQLEAIMNGEDHWFLECVELPPQTVDSLPLKRPIKLDCKKVTNG